MKSKFNKKVFLGLVLILAFGLISVGCFGVPQPTPTPTPTPTTCTVIVNSHSNLIWGIVYMDGNPVPSGNLAPWGSVQVNNVSVGVRHTFKILRLSTFSDPLFITPVPGTNYVDFYNFNI